MKEQFFSKIVGTTFVTNSYELMSNLGSGDKLLLQREPNNKYDSNAIAVLNTDSKKLGHIPKDTAVELSRHIDNGKQWQCYVSEITGHQYQNLGCNIKIILE